MQNRCIDYFNKHELGVAFSSLCLKVIWVFYFMAVFVIGELQC